MDDRKYRSLSWEKREIIARRVFTLHTPSLDLERRQCVPSLVRQSIPHFVFLDRSVDHATASGICNSGGDTPREHRGVQDGSVQRARAGSSAVVVVTGTGYRNVLIPGGGAEHEPTL